MLRLTRSALSLSVIVFALLLPARVSAQDAISVTPTSFTLQANIGTNVPTQTTTVRKLKTGVVKWSVVWDPNKPAWLVVSPTSGQNNATLSLSFQTNTLAAGPYQTSFRVVSGTTSIPVTVQVTMNAAAGPPLVLSCPANMTVSSPNGLPVAVSYNASPSGGVAPYTISGTPASGSLFPIGTTPVTVTAKSNDGQTTSCGFTVTVTYSPTTAVGPQSPITCPEGAVDISPGQPIQLIVDSFLPPKTFCLRAGVHQLTSSIRPRTGDTFVGEFGAILDGTGWTTADDTQAAFRAHNEDIDSVTIRNLVIRNMPQRGIQAFYWMSDHWTIEYNEIAFNKYGIEFGPDFTIKNNYIHHNLGDPGQAAARGGAYVAQYAHNTTFDNNEIAYNGSEQKVGVSANVTFRNNFVHHNVRDGIWYDSNTNAGALIEGNRVEDNGRVGISFEASIGATIKNNTLRRNKGDALLISMSQNVQIYNNVLEANVGGIEYFLNCGSLPLGEDVKNNSVYDNTINVGTQIDAYGSGFGSTGCTSAQLAPYLNGSKDLTFLRNTYRVPSTTGRYWLWGGWKYWNEWQLLGHDVNGSVSQ